MVFVDLIKSFDTINHGLMLVILKKYGFPPKMVTTIERPYEKFALIFEKGKEMISVEYLTGVHKGGKLASFPSVVAFQATMESLQLAEERREIDTPVYRCFKHTKKANQKVD